MISGQQISAIDASVERVDLDYPKADGFRLDVGRNEINVFDADGLAATFDIYEGDYTYRGYA